MQKETKFDALALSVGQKANGLFSDLIYAGRFIKSKDDIASDEIRQHLCQMLRAAKVRIDGMLKTLE